MPRAAVLSIHARVAGAEPSSWEHSSLVQVWGPRFSAYVVAARDHAVFTLGRLPDDARGLHRAEDTAARLHAFLDGRRMRYDEAGRGFELREVAGGWRFYTRASCAAYVERFVLDGQQARLTQAALETLAVVAYRQPVSRARVSAVRGVNCDGVMRTLVLRGLIAEDGTDPDTGAILFGTTSYFLERLGLASLADLPPLAPFLPDDLDEAEELQS